MVIDFSAGHVATRDLSKLVLIRTGDMRVRRLVLEFDTVGIGVRPMLRSLWSLCQSFPLEPLELPCASTFAATGASRQRQELLQAVLRWEPRAASGSPSHQ
jgi:hypothetical protein